MWRYLAAIFVVMLASKVWAQDSPVAFERLSTADGLGNNDIRDIAQDKQGYLWISTADGLNRYDGYTTTLFRNNRKDSTSLRSNLIHKTFVDRDGVVWVLSYEYLHQFHPKQHTFSWYRLPNDYTLTHAYAESIAQSNDGSLWLTMGIHLYRFYNGRFERFTPPYPPEHFISTAIYHSRITSLIADTANNCLWCGTVGAVYCFDIDRRTFTRFPVEENGVSAAYVASIVLGNQDTLWLGVSRLLNPSLSACPTGIFALNHRTGLHQRLRPDRDSSHRQQPEVEVNNMTVDKEQWIWMATYTGLYKFHPRTFQFQHFQHDSKNPQSLASNMLSCVFCDGSGVIWVGSSTNGISKYAPYRQKFQLYRHNPYDENSLSNNYVRGILEDDNGNLFVATQFGGLNRLNRRSGVWTHFRGGPIGRDFKLSTDNIRAVLQDKDGSIWIGSHTPPALERLYPHTNRIEQIKGYPSIAPINMFYHARSGEIWICNESTAILRLSPDRKSLLPSIPKSLGSYNFGNAHTLLEDRFGDIWVGTEFGLFQLDSLFNVKKAFFHSATDSTTVSSNLITHAVESSAGELWFATKGGGICRYNRQNGSFVHFTETEGLPHNNTYAILEDARGNFWISTDNGICEFNPVTKAVRKFGVTDGLQNTEFNRFAYFKNKRGEMFFGGINGLNSFFPDRIKLNPNPPTVALTSIKLTDNTLFPVDIGDTVQLQRDQNELTFELTAFEYTSPERNRYACFLEGYDKTWRDLGTKREAVYTNLDAGAYTLYIRAANSDGTWSAEKRAAHLTIEPMLWERWWFRVFAVAVLVFGFAAFYQIRIKRIETQNHTLEIIVRRSTEEILQRNRELADANRHLADTLNRAEAERQRAEVANRFKTELLGIVAHDLKNPLQTILGFSLLIQEISQDKSSTAEPALHIQRAANRMLKLIDDLLQSAAVETGQIALNNEAVDVTLLLEATVNDNRLRAEQKLQKIIFAGDAETTVYGDPARLREVFENLLSNALKFSPVNSTVWVTVKKILVTESRMRRATDSRQPSVVRITFKDEGQGITENDMNKLFGKFQKLSAKPTGGETSTGLGLSITKQLVELHGGNVWAESEGRDKGTTFFIELPALLPNASFRQEHLTTSADDGSKF